MYKYTQSTTTYRLQHWLWPEKPWIPHKLCPHRYLAPRVTCIHAVGPRWMQLHHSPAGFRHSLYIGMQTRAVNHPGCEKHFVRVIFRCIVWTDSSLPQMEKYVGLLECQNVYLPIYAVYPYLRAGFIGVIPDSPDFFPSFGLSLFLLLLETHSLCSNPSSSFVVFPLFAFLHSFVKLLLLSSTGLVGVSLSIPLFVMDDSLRDLEKPEPSHSSKSPHDADSVIRPTSLSDHSFASSQFQSLDDDYMSRIQTAQTQRSIPLERHPTAISRITTHRSQHSATVGASLRTRTSKSPLPEFGAGKPYPPMLPSMEDYVVEFAGQNDPLHPQNWSTKKK